MALPAFGQELPDPAKTKTVEMFRVPNYCEGVVFDHDGNGYISLGDTITQFTLDGKHQPLGRRPVRRTATRFWPMARIWSATPASMPCCICPPMASCWTHASKECDGKPLRGPNDLTLDTPNGGFYFSDPGDSSIDKPIGTMHYVDKSGKTHLVDDGLAFPNGIVLTPDGKKLLSRRKPEEPRADLRRDRARQSSANESSSPICREERTRTPQIDNQPDGMCLDAAGNLYVAHYGMKQVQVLNPDRQTHPPVTTAATSPPATSPSAARSMDQLFITGGLGPEAGEGGLFRIDLGVKGLVILPAKK